MDTLGREKLGGAYREIQVDSLRVQIHPDLKSMAHAAALTAERDILALLARKQAVRIIVASATSQKVFLECLTASTQVEWSRVHLFHMDEYLGLVAEHPGSFRYFLKKQVMDKIAPASFSFIQGDAPEPLKECARYSELLKQQPIDLCFLGIGENGHIAFNDPPVADFNDPYLVKIVKLDELSRLQQVREGFYPSLEAVPAYAYTLTIPALCGADEMLCIVPGKQKAKAVQATICEPISVQCPASILRHHPRATLFLDQNSAAGISGLVS